MATHFLGGLLLPPFTFAQRARCAAAILLRPAAEIVRLMRALPEAAYPWIIPACPRAVQATSSTLVR
jgi:hypothetical protein